MSNTACAAQQGGTSACVIAMLCNSPCYPVPPGRVVGNLMACLQCVDMQAKKSA